MADVKKTRRTYILLILGVFTAMFALYMGIAWGVLAPAGYYGTVEKPRFADPWIARAETILNGGMLYRDVRTTTPPLINFLLVPPALVSGLFNHRNPWATLAFMGYFSLYNLFTAYILLYMAQDAEEGYRAALYFLLNPLTFGNSILRRQDEPILAFFFALSLLFLIHHRHLRAGVTIGLTSLIKLSGLLMIPIAFLHTRRWEYVVLPLIIFGLVTGLFIITAGRKAVFWDTAQTGTQHPFQFDGISLGALWEHMRSPLPRMVLTAYSAILVLGSALALAFAVWKPGGLLEDLALLVSVVLMLTPKLHCGYLMLPTVVMTPLVHRRGLAISYFLFGLLALIADMCKWPLQDYPTALILMAGAFIMLIMMLVRLRRCD